MSNGDYQISVESAKIKIGPFTINVEQDRTVSVPSSKPDDKIGLGETLPGLTPGLTFMVEALKRSGMATPTPQPRVINLRCKQCHIAEGLPHVEAVREFMLLHAGHPIEMVP